VEISWSGGEIDAALGGGFARTSLLHALSWIMAAAMPLKAFSIRERVVWKGWFSRLLFLIRRDDGNTC